MKWSTFAKEEITDQKDQGEIEGPGEKGCVGNFVEQGIRGGQPGELTQTHNSCCHIAPILSQDRCPPCKAIRTNLDCLKDQQVQDHDV